MTTKPNPEKFDGYDIVRGFDIIARKYDRGNDAMTFGLHRRWRSRLCRAAAEATPPGGRLLDLATGTADVILGVLTIRPDIRCVGVDPSAGMLQVGREKLAAARLPAAAEPPVLQEGDARRLPFPDNSFDTVTIAWGIRNVQPFTDGLREIFRVLKPGGHALVLESGTPLHPLARGLYQAYSALLPLIGGTVSGYKDAYEYYKLSVERFPSDHRFVAVMRETGFDSASFFPLMLGVIYLYSARKP